MFREFQITIIIFVQVKMVCLCFMIKLLTQVQRVQKELNVTLALSRRRVGTEDRQRKCNYVKVFKLIKFTVKSVTEMISFIKEIELII